MARVARAGLSAQKKTLADDERQTERVQALRAAFQEQMKELPAEDLVFVDESGCNRAMTRTHARSPKGQRAFGTAPRNWGENVSILGAISQEGPLATRWLPGATDGLALLAYRKEVLMPKLWPGAVVVLDNLGAHKVAGGRELLESAGARLVYLPPSSPAFNPIEMAWSKLKAHLRKVAARDTEALGRAIKEGLATITPADTQGFFRHGGYVA